MFKTLVDKRVLTLLIYVVFHVALAAQPVKVGLFQDHLITKAVVYCSGGSYTLLAGERELAVREGDILYFTLEDGKIRLLDAGNDYGFVESIEMKAIDLQSAFRLRPLEPELSSRIYDDDLLVGTGDRFLTLVNRIDLDKYLAGVVEAEAGAGAGIEFYKAQAMLCRTYALQNYNRHESEGFSLCDGVHCQAYKGKSVHDPVILEAVLETTGMVVADFNYKLITAAYHSNSGGQTQRAADVWLRDTEYLQSVVDPYSLHQPHAKWRDTISFGDWKDYLSRNGMKAVGRIPDEIVYVEQRRRKKNFVLDGDSLRMTKIREDWGFRSAFFDMFPDGDSVLVWGKGYGHGIGMSQEGAMKMASDDFSHEDILHFYFFNIRLMDYRDLPRSSLPSALMD